MSGRTAWLFALTLIACGGSENDGSEKDAGSTGGSAGSAGASGSGGGLSTCPAGDCSLDCDPTDSALALDWEGVKPSLQNLGDSDTATPDEVGDGLYHLFAGVAHIDITDANSWGAVFIHDATAKSPLGPFTLPPDPIVVQRDSYDQYGIEVPSYLRFDEHTEYIYYCGLYSIYPSADGEESANGRISALKRVDGGAWTKLGPVVELGAGSKSQCEPDALLNPATGTIYLFFIADGDEPGMRVRTSKSPESFSPDTEIGLGKYFSRIGSSFDPFANVWRYSLDVGGYPVPIWTAQSWSTTVPPDDTTLQANGEILHSGDHDLHLDFHHQGPTVSQTSGAFYPDPSQVIFYYTGQKDEIPFDMRVFSQTCTRR